MLELKGELVFKTVAYHRAADAIGRSPVDLVAAYRAGQAARDPGRRQGHQRQDRRARHDRPHGLLRPAPRRGPAEPRRAARRSRASGPRRSASSTRELGIETVDDLRQAAEDGPAPDVCAACRPGPRRSSSRASPGSTTGSTGCSSAPAEDAHRRAHRRPGARRPASARSSRPARSAAARSRSATSTSSPRPTGPRR